MHVPISVHAIATSAVREAFTPRTPPSASSSESFLRTGTAKDTSPSVLRAAPLAQSFVSAGAPLVPSALMRFAGAPWVSGCSSRPRLAPASWCLSLEM